MDSIKIEIPVTVENDYYGFNFMSYLFTSTEGFADKNIELNFKSTRWFEANLASVLGAWIESKVYDGCTIIMSDINVSIEKVFKKNGFYETYNLGAINDTFDSTIKYHVFSVSEVDEFSNYVTDNVIPKIRLDLSNSVEKSFKLSLNEVFLNVNLHARSDKVYTCGQYYHKNNKVAFTISDLGNTIGLNVRNKYPHIEFLDHEAIDWATHYGHTTKDITEAGGIGLHIIDEFLTSNNGIFQIISGNGFWENNEGNINTRLLEYYFPGTVVNIISKLEQTFSLNSEIFF
ncbi:hypothetical protein [Domibacillus mangrovi]|uniref:Uncharacterized protein n=1 Tax=Domibacillus mangrovi TaxID=1714354 RepID=A0A1Q5P814_9BACI|nr:hypothetical protein [Domibacillus mangrovi]OKL38344.1 hypothetical protein BLL40_02700 [Domibacillus mangrovi]